MRSTQSGTSLPEILEEAARPRRRLTVYGPSVPEWLTDQFAETSVRIRRHPLPDGESDPFLVVTDVEADRVLGATSLSTLESAAEPSVRPVGSPSAARREFSDLVSTLSDLTFSSLDRRQLLAATREIEDRAFREGRGRLYAGFQSLSTFVGERETYRRIADAGVECNVYGTPDVAVDAVADGRTGLTVHDETADEIARTWFVVYDGDPMQKSALLAEERDDGEFFGFWTYDPEIVNRVVWHLEATYR